MCRKVHCHPHRRCFSPIRNPKDTELVTRINVTNNHCTSFYLSEGIDEVCRWVNIKASTWSCLLDDAKFSSSLSRSTHDCFFRIIDIYQEQNTEDMKLGWLFVNRTRAVLFAIRETHAYWLFHESGQFLTYATVHWLCIFFLIERNWYSLLFFRCHLLFRRFNASRFWNEGSGGFTALETAQFEKKSVTMRKNHSTCLRQKRIVMIHLFQAKNRFRQQSKRWSWTSWREQFDVTIIFYEKSIDNERWSLMSKIG